jgi:hypothetical protein
MMQLSELFIGVNFVKHGFVRSVRISTGEE